MNNDVKMHTPALGQHQDAIIRVKSGYLPQITNSLGNTLRGNIVQVIYKDGTTDEVAIVRDFETYGEPSGGLYIPFVKIAVHRNGKKERYSFQGKDRETSAQIDFEKIAPERRGLIKIAEEAISQSKELSKNDRARDGGETRDTFEVLENLPKPPSTPQPGMPAKKETALSRFFRGRFRAFRS